MSVTINLFLSNKACETISLFTYPECITLLAYDNPYLSDSAIEYFFIAEGIHVD